MTFHLASPALTAAWLAALLLSPPAWGQSGSEPATLTARHAREDFDLLRRALEEAHGGLHRFTPKPDLDRAFDAHQARLDRPITTRAFAGILAEAIAELRDGHARLELDSATSSALGDARLLPLRVRIEDGRLMVLFNDAAGDTTVRPGMEILSIDGRAASDLIARLAPGVSRDGFIETGRRVRLAREFPRLHWLHVEPGERYAIEARDPEGRRISATLAGVRDRDRAAVANPVNRALADRLARLDGPAGNVALEFLGDSSLARLRIRAFAGQSFTAQLDSAFAALRARGVEGLILDLRGNGGGVDEYGAYLVGRFMDRPFRYFDRIRVTTIAPSFATWPARTFLAMRTGTVPDPGGGFRVTAARHPGVGEQAPAEQPWRGRLVVLIDGGTFSTAADVAAQLRSRGGAAFIGEETGGTYEGNTSGLNALLVLPHSGLGLKIMMYGYYNAVRPPRGPGRGTLPDHEVPSRVADLLAGIDRPLERALAILR